MPTTDPNPSTNPGIKVQCANCKAQGITQIWDWHLPPNPNNANGWSTEIGDHTSADPTRPTELNANYPHCPFCGSWAVDVLQTYDPSEGA